MLNWKLVQRANVLPRDSEGWMGSVPPEARPLLLYSSKFAPLGYLNMVWALAEA